MFATHLRARAVACAVAVAAASAVLAGSPAAHAASISAHTAAGAPPTANVVVTRQTAQRIDGFGFSEAFGQTQNILALPAAARQAVARLLFSPTEGAGLDILRFGLGGAGTVADQRWIGDEALRYGVHTFYADSWSAPAALKTNDSLDNGGYLCGVPGETCASGDARAAYAAQLASQAQSFARAGFPLRAIDPVNEPELAPDYAGMLMTPAQAADFVPYLGRALEADGLQTQVACCDAEGWQDAGQYADALLASPQSARYVGLITGHGYTSPPVTPLTSQRPVWETEWSTFQAFDPAWDDGSTASGLTWANNIYTALTSADVNAFLYWWGASTTGEGGDDNEGLISLTGSSYVPSSRLWAFAGFSRFVRPGAVRLLTTSSVPGLLTVAFRRDGQRVLVAINNNDQPVTMAAQLQGGPVDARAVPYLTDASSDVAAQPSVPVVAGRLSVQVPARSLVTYTIDH